MSYDNGNENGAEYRDYDTHRKKNKVIVVITIAVAVFAVFGFICASVLGFTMFTRGTISNVASSILNRVDKDFLVKEEFISLTDVNKLYLDVSFHEVSVNATDDSVLSVRQYGPENLGSEDKFTLRKNSGRVTITIKETRFSSSTINIGRDNIVELDIPKSWIGNVYLTTISGSMLIDDSFLWGDVELKSASGSITSNGTISCSDIHVSSSSGSIEVNDAITSTDDVTLKSTSGQISMANDILADAVYVKSSSGSIRLNNSASINARTLNIECTSGSINGNALTAERYDISSSSGGINLNSIIGQGRINCISGDINVKKLAINGDTSISSVSGSVNIAVPKKLSFNLIGSTKSGSFNTGFSINYKDDKKRSVSASIGDGPFVDLAVKSTSGSISIDQYN